MASDLSSGCTEVIEILDEKEEGEISLEDVSSSEEGQLNDGCISRRKAAGQCPTCLSTKHCALWCTTMTRTSQSKNSIKKDAVQEKENCHHTKDSGYSGSKHPASTLQENNSDLIPISSDSDMEIVGLADSVKQVLSVSSGKTTKVRKRKKKRWSQSNFTSVESTEINPLVNLTVSECSTTQKRDTQVLKDNHSPRVHRKESHSPQKRSGSPFSRSRTVKSPVGRHRSPIRRARSPFVKSRLPPEHPWSSVTRKSPIRRPRSPMRRSPPLSPLGSPTRRQSRKSISPPRTSVDNYGNVNKLLKKVRHLKTVGSQSTSRNVCRSKGHGASLKDKLNNMMKGDNGSNNITDKGKSENGDDEEDLALLRKMALETKSKKNGEVQENTELNEETHCGNNNIGDDDIEDLELRWIALRSAMLKKHQDRMQRGVTVGKTKKPTVLARSNTQSPFSQSFYDGIPIPDEDKVEFKSPPHTPTQVLNENTNPEDMELDSEVELEKEKETEPYSPTDEISRQIIIDTELLGIQPSDVSFITPTSQNTITSNTSSFQTSQSSEIEMLQTGASYLPSNEITDKKLVSSSVNYYSNINVLPSSQSPTSSLYSPTNATETLVNNNCPQSDDNLLTAPYSPSQPIETPDVYFPSQDDPCLNADSTQISDTPYSPTDTPIYDLELSSTALLSDAPSIQQSDIVSKSMDKLSREKCGKKRRKSKLQSALIEINLLSQLPEDIVKAPNSNTEENTLSPPVDSHHEPDQEKNNVSEKPSMNIDAELTFNSTLNSLDSTMITVDELPETDLDGSPLVPIPKEPEDIEIHIPPTMSQDMLRLTREPLYLQGVPGVTKDPNKVPTLVNRSLVPSSILKSNKNLQQPLPPKKIETHLEPAFKSAEMQPVQICTETTKSNPVFKPIKLAPVIKKPQLKIVTPAAFNCSSNDHSVLEDHVESENFKSTHVPCTTETENILEASQNGRVVQNSNKTSETIDTMPPSGNVLSIGQPIKTLPFSTSEQQTITIQNQEKNKDFSRISNRASLKNVEINSNIKKKRRSRRSRSTKNRSQHQANKTVKDNKNAETKDMMTNISKVVTTQQKECMLHHQSHNLNVTNKNHSSEESYLKNKNSRDRLKEPVVEIGKKDREKRSQSQSVSHSDNKSKSGHRRDKQFEAGANKVEDRRINIKKHSRKSTEARENIEHTIKNHSSDVEKKPDNTTTTQLKSSLNINQNIQNEKGTDRKTTDDFNEKKIESKKTNVNISELSTLSDAETKVTENSTTISNSCTQDTEDSTMNNAACKKVEASKRRRSSLDEDEEELRAILLASLAKRSKPSDSVNTTTKTTALTDLSYSSGNTSTESLKSLPNTPGTKVSFNSIYSSNSDSTPPLLNHNSSNLSNSSSNKDLPPEPSLQEKISNTAVVDSTSSDKVTYVHTMLSAAPSRKRSISGNVKAPLKKVVKKIPIPASTKVVNNAKKYQNTLVQKKLNLQKVAMISNARKTLSRTNLHTNTTIDNSRSKSMITQPLSDTQRFVINLASDSETDDEAELQYKNATESLNNGKLEQKQILTIPMSDFEKSVDLFLKDVRKKQETAAAIKPSSMTNVPTQKSLSPVTSTHRKSPILSTTPLAVRHLPVSQQEEYRRLKQQIVEREKLKLHKTLLNNTSPLSPVNKSSSTPPGPLSPATSINSPTSKQNHNIPLSSQSQMPNKNNSARSVSVQSTEKTTVSSITTKANPVISGANNVMSSLSNLSIQIPNKLPNVNLASRKSNNTYIPVSTSQTKVVTIVKLNQEPLNTKDSKDSTITTKDQFSLKNIEVQLQQGKTGRTVSLGETISFATKPGASKNREIQEVEGQESSAVKSSVNTTDRSHSDKSVPTELASSCNLSNSKKTVDSVDIEKKCDNSVDFTASTIIISREGERTENSNLIDSSTSTVIIPRNEKVDSCKLESVSSEDSDVNCPLEKLSKSEPRRLKNNKETWEKIRGDVKKELEAISTLPSSEQRSYLATAEQNLVKKRYAMLDDLSEISGKLRQLEMEKEMQANMALEVQKLQEQLKLAEERFQMQRDRVNKMVPNIATAYEKLNNGRQECVKITRVCLGLGSRVIGANYKIPAAGAQLLNKRMKQVAECNRQLSKNKIPTTEKTDEVLEQINSPSQTSNSENCLSNSEFVSTSSTVSEDNIEQDNEPMTVDRSTIMEAQKNSNTELAASPKAQQNDSVEEETLRCEESETTGPSVDSVSIDLPKSTSTPNSSAASLTGLTQQQDHETTITTFVLDSPEAGLSGQKKDPEQNRFIQPYKSVLTHLKVPRTTDPSGILCPYELMGTCRDDDCNFLHQSARNG